MPQMLQQMQNPQTQQLMSNPEALQAIMQIQQVTTGARPFMLLFLMVSMLSMFLMNCKHIFSMLVFLPLLTCPLQGMERLRQAAPDMYQTMGLPSLPPHLVPPPTAAGSPAAPPSPSAAGAPSPAAAPAGPPNPDQFAQFMTQVSSALA